MEYKKEQEYQKDCKFNICKYLRGITVLVRVYCRNETKYDSEVKQQEQELESKRNEEEDQE